MIGLTTHQRSRNWGSRQQTAKGQQVVPVVPGTPYINREVHWCSTANEIGRACWWEGGSKSKCLADTKDSPDHHHRSYYVILRRKQILNKRRLYSTYCVRVLVPVLGLVSWCQYQSFDHHNKKYHVPVSCTDEKVCRSQSTHPGLGIWYPCRSNFLGCRCKNCDLLSTWYFLNPAETSW